MKVLVETSAHHVHVSDEALEAFQKAVELNPKYARAYYNIAKVYFKTENYKEACKNIEKAIFLDDSNSDYYMLRGKTSLRMDEFEDAEKDFTKVLSYSVDEDAFFYRAQVRYLLRNFEDAISDCNYGLELNPENSYIYLARGDAEDELERYSDAIKDYNKSIELNSENEVAYNLRGTTFEKLGEIKKAYNDFKKAVSLDPDYEAAKNNLERIKEKLPEKEKVNKEKIKKCLDNTKNFLLKENF